MFVFVFEDVLVEYSAGMAVVVAKDLKRAQEMVWKEFDGRGSVEEFLVSEKGCGFEKASVKFRVGDDEVEQMKYVYGGS